VTVSVTELPAQILPFVRQANLISNANGLDRRQHAFRPDLAHIDLADRVGAQRYVQPIAHYATASVTGIHSHADAASENLSQLQFGEIFHVLERGPDWCWGQTAHDHYVGYVATSALTAGLLPVATHWVSAPHAHVYQKPSIKAEVLHPLWRGSPVSVISVDEKFAALAEGGFVRRNALSPVGTHATDWVAQAEDFIGTAYLWGGRTRAGIDCSGLVQTALMACGMSCLRDTDMQARSIGQLVPENQWHDLQRGDFIFFPGHVGIMHNSENLLHANAHHMKTVIEPLAGVIARLKPEYEKPVTSVRRITALNFPD
jgi:cell wall-associated NlpC family hydrolase